MWVCYLCSDKQRDGGYCLKHIIETLNKFKGLPPALCLVLKKDLILNRYWYVISVFLNKNFCALITYIVKYNYRCKS